VRTRLLALGYSEAISSTFASQADSDLFYNANHGNGAGTVAMENPLSDEATLLRPALVPGMLTMLGHNLNRDVRTVRLFEQGTIFTGSTSEVRESASLSLGLTGAVAAAPLYPAADAPFFELKGVVESLLSLFDLAGPALEVRFAAEGPAWLEGGRAATVYLGGTVSGTVLARFGELTRSERERRKLRQPVYLAELDLARLYALPLKRSTARELSRFQAVERDFSFTFPDTTPWATLATALGGLSIPELERSSPEEIFRDAKGKAVPAEHYALLVRCVFQSHERTLREEELTAWSAKIMETLSGLGGVLRG
jgi:phenylalanyl-tRNA synthetase beta chain